MAHRHVARLLLLSLIGAGVLTFTAQLDDRPPSVALASAQTTAVPTTAMQRLSGSDVSSVDESTPHDHVFDPETGGLVSVKRAAGVVPGATRLGPMHADPMPAGVSTSSSTSTRALLKRASGLQATRAEPGAPFGAGAAAPLGTPGISTLSSHVSPACSGDGRDGNRVQVLYVHEGPSRLSSVLPILRNEVANVDDVFALSARQTGGELRVRWVHDSYCVPYIKDVTVPRGALGSDFFGTIAALRKLGFDATNRKYLMFADANKFCGIGTVYEDRNTTNNANDGRYASYARVDANCWSTSESVAAHELTHNLGGVQASAPHATKYGHCYDESDLMCYDDGSGVRMRTVCPASQGQLLDCRNDDYFNTAPAAGSYLAKSWNTARSSFLVTLPATPDVRLSGSRSTAQTGDQVTFTASSSKSVTWSWAASSSSCSLTRSGARAVLVCPSTVTGTVKVTATAKASSGATRAETASVTLTRAATPSAAVTAPSATSGTFEVRATPSGKAPFSYNWQAASCTVRTPTSATSTVVCPASTQPRDVTVGVAVKQADGQSRSITRTVRLG